MVTPPVSQSIVFTDRDHCISVYGNAILSFSLQSPNPRCLEAWTAAVDQMVHATGAPVSVMIVIDSSARPPDESVKRDIRNTTTRHGQNIGVFAYVIEGEGFGAAALRGAVSLISLAARYPFPQKVFKSVDQAAAYMIDRMPSNLPSGVAVSGVRDAVDLVRHRVKPLAAAL